MQAPHKTWLLSISLVLICLSNQTQAHSHKSSDSSQAVLINWDGSILYNPAIESPYEAEEISPFDFDMDLLPIFHLEGDRSFHRISLTRGKTTPLQRANPKDGYVDIHRWKARGGPGFLLSEGGSIVSHGTFSILPYVGAQAMSLRTIHHFHKSSPHKLPQNIKTLQTWHTGDQVSWETVTGLYIPAGINFHHLFQAVAETEYRGLWRIHVKKTSEKNIQIDIVPIQFLTAGLGTGALLFGARKAKLWGHGQHFQFDLNPSTAHAQKSWLQFLRGRIPYQPQKTYTSLAQPTKKSKLTIRGQLQGSKFGLPFLATHYREKSRIHVHNIQKSWSSPNVHVSLGGWKKEVGSEGIFSNHRQNLSAFFGSSLSHKKKSPHHQGVFMWHYEQKGARHQRIQGILNSITEDWGGQNLIKTLKPPRTRAGFFRAHAYLNLSHKNIETLRQSLQTEEIIKDLKLVLKKHTSFCRMHKSSCFRYWKAPTLRMMHTTRRWVENILQDTTHEHHNAVFSKLGENLVEHPLYLKVILEHLWRTKQPIEGGLHISGEHIAHTNFRIKQVKNKDSYQWSLQE